MMKTFSKFPFCCTALALAVALPTLAQIPTAPPAVPPSGAPAGVFPSPPGGGIAVPAPLAAIPSLTNLPGLDTANTNVMDASEGPEAILNAIFGRLNEAGQTNQPGDETTADTNAATGDGFLRPGRPGSRSEVDGRQSRRSRFSRPDAQRSGAAGDVAGGSAAAAGTNAPSRLDYAYYRLITERNIFNPNRRPYRPTQPREAPPIRPNTDYVSLVGVMRYDDGDFAFFTGNLSKYEKTAKVAETIANCKVAAINVGSNSVKIDAGTNRLELQVGMSMRVDEEGVWHVSRTPAMFSSYNSTPNPGSDSVAPSTAAAPGGSAPSADDNDVIKRLMERRNQQ